MSMDDAEAEAPLEPAPAADPPPAPPGAGPGPGAGPEVWLSFAEPPSRSRASAPEAIGDASIASKVMTVEVDEVSAVASQPPTEPPVIVDAPNAASSRLTCRACRPAELVDDCSVADG
jgi:hypothetical protein